MRFENDALWKVKGFEKNKEPVLNKFIVIKD